MRVSRIGVLGMMRPLSDLFASKPRPQTTEPEHVIALVRSPVHSLELCVYDHRSCKGQWLCGFLSINYCFPKTSWRPDSSMHTRQWPLPGCGLF